MSRVVSVTGATGFIGGVVVRHLLKAGIEVRALVRPCSLEKCTRHPGLEWVTGDLEDAACLERLIHGAHAVVHCAGTVRGRRREDFHKVNVEASGRLAEICSIRPGPLRFLLISSLAARQPELSYYALSKKMGEDALIKFGGGMAWTILRPPAVYGPGDREILPLFRCMEKGLAPCFGNRENHFSLVHVLDLAEAVLCLLGSGLVSGKVYELHDGMSGGYSWDDVAGIVERVYGNRVVRLRIPVTVVRVAGFLNAAVSGISGRSPLLTTGKARELAHPDWVCDNTDIFRDTGWVPRILLEDALKRRLI